MKEFKAYIFLDTLNFGKPKTEVIYGDTDQELWEEFKKLMDRPDLLPYIVEQNDSYPLKKEANR